MVCRKRLTLAYFYIIFLENIVSCTQCQSDTATVYLNIADSINGSHARALLSRSLQIGRFVCPFRATRSNPGATLCQRCWRWGHPMSQCRAPQIRCPICSGPHHAEHHHTLGGCCKGNAKANPPIPPTAPDMLCPHPPWCPNCRKDHSADSRKCAFWRHRFDQDWIKARYAEVRATKGTRPGAIREGVREAYPSATRVEAALPTSMSYLKLVDVPR
jgi:hypothetical protein